MLQDQEYCFDIPLPSVLTPILVSKDGISSPSSCNKKEALKVSRLGIDP